MPSGTGDHVVRQDVLMMDVRICYEYTRVKSRYLMPGAMADPQVAIIYEGYSVAGQHVTCITCNM